MAAPSAAILRTNCNNCVRVATSAPAVGSSSNSRSGRCNNAMAVCSRRFCPPDSSAARFPSISVSPMASATSSMEEVADAIGLTEMLGKRAAELSGGQKRRLHTAMALLHRPDLLLLDEPTAGADVATRTQLLQLVRKMAAEGAAIVYSTHYLPEVEELGASVAILETGVIVARGTCDELLAANTHAAVELVFDG